jgi:CelD/BcsL family acetyltransferase involved in cellulose biosynthesis
MTDGSTTAVFTSRGWSVECVTTHEALVALKGEWQELERAAGTDLPFQTWEWCVSWWAHFREDRVGVRDSLRVCTIRLHDQLVGIAPFMLTERPAVGPFRSRLLQFIGADPNITEVRTMLCVPDVADDCYAALHDFLSSKSCEWDWIAWQIPTSVVSAIAQKSTFVTKSERSAYVLDLVPTWEQFLTRLHRSIRGLVRKYYRDLAGDGLEVRLEVVDQPSAIAPALTDFFRLFAARETLKGSRGQPQLFASPQAQAFLSETSWRLACRDAARVFRLWVGNTMVATRVGFQLGDRLYLYYSGWDSDYARYGVMTVLLSEIIQYGIQHNLRSVHLSTGTDLSKTRWSPTELRYAEGVQISWRPAAAVRHRAHEAAFRIAASKLVSQLVPSVLLRRTRQDGTVEDPTPFRGLYARRLHGFAVAGAVLAVLDLLDGKLDHVLKVLPIGVS